MTTTLYVKDRVGESSSQADFYTRTSSISAATDIQAIKVDRQKSESAITNIYVTGTVENIGHWQTSLAIRYYYSPMDEDMDSILAGCTVNSGGDSGDYNYLHESATEGDWIYIMHNPEGTSSIYSVAPVDSANDDTDNPVVVRVGDEYISCKASGEITSGNQIESIPVGLTQSTASGWLKIYKRGCTRWGENVDDDDSGDGKTASDTGERFSQIRRHPMLSEVLNYGYEDGTDHNDNNIIIDTDNGTNFSASGVLTIGGESISYDDKSGSYLIATNRSGVVYAHFTDTWVISDNANSDSPVDNYGLISKQFSFNDFLFPYRDVMDKNVQNTYVGVSTAPQVIEITSNESAKVSNYVSVGDKITVTDANTNLSGDAFRVAKMESTWVMGTNPQITMTCIDDGIRAAAMENLESMNELALTLQQQRKTNTSAWEMLKDTLSAALVNPLTKKGVMRIGESVNLEFSDGDDDDVGSNTSIYREGDDLTFEDPNSGSKTLGDLVSSGGLWEDDSGNLKPTSTYDGDRVRVYDSTPDDYIEIYHDGSVGAIESSTEEVTIFADSFSKPVFTLQCDNASAQDGPELILDLLSGSPNDGMIPGVIKIKGNDDNTNATEYGRIETYVDDVSDTSEESIMKFYIQNSGSLSEHFRVSTAGVGSVDGTYLRALSVGNDKGVSIYHSDADGIIDTSSGSLLFKGDGFYYFYESGATPTDYLSIGHNGSVGTINTSSGSIYCGTDFEPLIGSENIGASGNRWNAGYFDDIYYTGGSLPDDYDDLKLIKEKYSPENYNGKDVSLNESLGLCIGAIKQLIDKVDILEERIENEFD